MTAARRIITPAFLALLAAAHVASAEEPRVLAVASPRQLGPREIAISVAFHNCGGRFDRDYVAFIHFDRSLSGSNLCEEPTPGPRSMVYALKMSKWEANTSVTVDFPAVVVPKRMGRVIYVKAGIYAPGAGGGRLPLIGADAADRRVLLGRIEPQGDGVRFVRMPPRAAAAKAETVGVRPRAMVRPMPDPPAVRFGEIDLSQWRVEGTNRGSARAVRTREALCWSEASLEITYAGGDRRAGFVVRPPQPMRVPTEADVARLWLMGRAYGWSKTRTSEEPLLAHHLEFRDRDGATRRLHFPRRIGYPYWYVARVRIPADWPRPLVWTGAGFTGCTNTRGRTLVLDALVFAKERLAKSLTTNVRLDDLPFPTDPDGLLPSQLAGDYTNRVARTGAECRLTYSGRDGELAYTYRPATGTLDDLRVAWRGADGRAMAARITAGGGPVLELNGRSHRPLAGGLRRTLKSFVVEANRVQTRWRLDAGDAAAEYTLGLSIRGKSLLVEVDAGDGALTAFGPGRIESGHAAQFIFFPYWSYARWDWGRDGGVALVDGVFVSGLVDWYRSRASRITFGPPAVSHRPEALADDEICYAPGVEYDTRSDGRRNPLRERFVFTVSPNVLETLPNIPHPASPNRDKLARLMHSTGGSAHRLAEQLDQWRELYRYGVADVYIRHFDGMWADRSQGPQEWTLTEHAAPLVGDAAMRRYLDELRGMGFTPVLYTNYTDLQPVAAEFGWDKIKLLPNGDISSFCWPGSYPLKPLRAVELEAKYAPRIAARFGTTGSFCDVHTAVAPWAKVDYDARLPGAAQFGTTYRCYAKLLLNERKTYGAVYSEGSIHWLYAGLHDGSDAQIRSPKPFREPFLVDFDLRKIHPKQMDAGMSWLSRYVESKEDAAALGGWEAAQDRFTAATLAFGHQGAFTGRSFRGYRTDIKTYYMLQPLQMLYAMREAKVIEYRDPKTGRMLDTSDAIRSGAFRHSQVHVRYASGLDVWVNGSFDQEWRVSAGRATYRLPPSGFVGAGPGPTLVFSAMLGEARVDYRSTPEARFIDARGKRVRLREFDTDGAAILRRSGRGKWSVYPLGQRSVLRIHAKSMGLYEPVGIVAYDGEGRELSRAEADMAGGFVVIPDAPGAHHFALFQGD